MKLFKYVIPLLFTFSIFFFSCGRPALLDEHREVNKKGWKAGDKIKLEVVVTDTNKLYDFYFDVRNTVDYPNMNVFFFITTTFPNGQKAKDTLECMLADLEGKWLGEGWGKIKSNRILFKNRIRFPMTGTYQFEIEHAMRYMMLTEISDIGLRIVESK